MEVGELQQTEAVEPKPMERRLLVYTCFRKASLGAHQGRAEDGAIAMGQQGAGMKNHSRPTKLSANSILLLLIFFFYILGSRFNCTKLKKSREVVQKHAAPSCFLHHTHHLHDTSLHKALSEMGLLVTSATKHTCRYCWGNPVDTISHLFVPALFFKLICFLQKTPKIAFSSLFLRS